MKIPATFQVFNYAICGFWLRALLQRFCDVTFESPIAFQLADAASQHSWPAGRSLIWTPLMCQIMDLDLHHPADIKREMITPPLSSFTQCLCSPIYLQFLSLPCSSFLLSLSLFLSLSLSLSLSLALSLSLSSLFYGRELLTRQPFILCIPWLL